MKTLYFFFGQVGAGKTYCAKRFAKKIGAHFYDGDDSLSLELRSKVEKVQPLTRSDIYGFITNYLAEDCVRLAESHDVLVVAQALYNEGDRLWLGHTLRRFGIDTIFVHIRTPFWRNLKQLWSRKNGLRWIRMWLISKPWFEQPTHYCVDIGPGDPDVG